MNEKYLLIYYPNMILTSVYIILASMQLNI